MSAHLTFCKKLKTQPDKKNDPNWCMQFLATAFGVVSLLIGASMATGFWTNFKNFYLIYFGIFWLLMAYVHRLKWLHKKELRDALALAQKLTAAKNEEAEQVMHVNRS